MTDTRLWVVTETDLIGLHRDDGGLVVEIPLTGELDTLISDGVQLWVTTLNRGSVSVLDLATGEEQSVFAPCANVIAPVFDGANMWFSCPQDNQLQSLPAVMTYFGVRNPVNDTEIFVPQIVDDTIWVAQEFIGRILIFDAHTRREIASVQYNQEIDKLRYDPPYMWTAIEGTGTIIRFDTRDDNPLANPATLRLGRSVGTLDIIGQAVWADYNDGSFEYTLTLIDRETLDVIMQPPIEGVISDFALTNDDAVVWFSSAAMEEGQVYRMNSQTGEIEEQFDIPDTPFFSWRPLLLGDELWFTAVMPPTTMFITTLACVTLSCDHIPYRAAAYNYVTDEWTHVYPLPGFVGSPEWDGRYLWYTYVETNIEAQTALSENTHSAPQIDEILNL